MADDRFVVEDHVPPNSPQKKSSGGNRRWILGCIFAAVLTPFLLSCGCCAALLVMGGNAQIKSALASVQNDPTFQAEIGKNVSASIDYSNVLAEGSKRAIFNVTGENGSGKLTGSYLGDFVVSMVLEKEGQTWNLQVEDPDPSSYSVDEDLLSEFENEPKLQEELGEIKHLSYNLRASIQEDDPDAFHYEVVGEKGRGRLTAFLGDEGGWNGAELEVGGKVVDLKMGDGEEEGFD